MPLCRHATLCLRTVWPRENGARRHAGGGAFAHARRGWKQIARQFGMRFETVRRWSTWVDESDGETWKPSLLRTICKGIRPTSR
jgi:hypothetical protein